MRFAGPLAGRDGPECHPGLPAVLPAAAMTEHRPVQPLLSPGVSRWAMDLVYRVDQAAGMRRLRLAVVVGIYPECDEVGRALLHIGVYEVRRWRGDAIPSPDVFAGAAAIVIADTSPAHTVLTAYNLAGVREDCVLADPWGLATDELKARFGDRYLK